MEVWLEERDTRDLRLVVVFGELLRLLLCVAVLRGLFRDGYVFIVERRFPRFVRREEEFVVGLFLS